MGEPYVFHILYCIIIYAYLIILSSFVVVTILNKRERTPVSKHTVNPVYSLKDATFNFPLYLSLADKLGYLELVVWDKDMLKKEREGLCF